MTPDVAGLGARIDAGDLTLEPLAIEHAEALARAFVDDELWTWMISAAPRGPAGTQAWIADALARAAAGEHVTFVVRLPDGRLAGTTRYLDIRLVDAAVEIGWTLVFAHARGGWINARVKSLLLERAFACGFERVTFKTDARNARSRAAIAALGAHFEGVLRAYQRRHDGTLRDTAMFSVLAAEWPGVRTALDARVRSRRDRSLANAMEKT